LLSGGHLPYKYGAHSNITTTYSTNQQTYKQKHTFSYEQAQINMGNGKQIAMTDVRNSDRCIIDSVDFADTIWQRIVAELPRETENDLHLKTIEASQSYSSIGLNERMRFLRYDPGGYFKPHYDGSFKYTADRNHPRYNAVSIVTCQIYLNEGFEGGATTFFDPKVNHENSNVDKPDNSTKIPYVPKTGSVLIFDHAMLHSGDELIRGRKYTIRTDVMYDRI